MAGRGQIKKIVQTYLFKFQSFLSAVMIISKKVTSFGNLKNPFQSLSCSQRSNHRYLHVLIGGGKGWIGKNLQQHLISKGHKVTLIARKPSHGNLTWKDFESRNILRDMALVNNKVDSVVVLTGANIAEKKWTEERKTELLESRIKPTQILTQQILDLDEKDRPNSFISGSAIGIYPSSSDKVFDENYNGQYDETFAGRLCSEWENSSKDLDRTNTRRVITRISIVLGKDGGFLKSTRLPLGISYVGKIGDGKQWFTWIHMKDLTRLIEHSIVNENIKGPINACSPNNVTNEEYNEILKKVTKRFTVPLPESVVNMVFGERAPLMLEGKQVVPSPVTSNSGFYYLYPNLEGALASILG